MKGMKILENAMKWKKLMANGGAGGAAAKSDDKSGVVDTVTEEPVTEAETETGGESESEGAGPAAVLGKRKDVPSSSSAPLESEDPQSIDIEDDSD